MRFWNFTAKPRAEESNNEILISIGSGSNGKIFFLLKKYTEAKPLLEYDYCYHILDNAGYFLQRIVRINLLQGKKDSALGQLNETLWLIRQKSKQPCLTAVIRVFDKRIKNIKKKIKTTAIYLQIKDQYGAGNISLPLSFIPKQEVKIIL